MGVVGRILNLILRGMYKFAIDERIYFARVGEKPLMYCSQMQILYFNINNT